MRRIVFTVFAAAALMLLGAMQAQAAVQIDLGGGELSGSGAGSIVSNAVQVKFENTTTTDEVKVTISVLDPLLKVKTIVLSVDPVITGLSIGSLSGPLPTLGFAANSTGLGGVLTGFDFELEYGTSGSAGDFSHLSSPSMFTLTGTGLTENSFSFANPNAHLGGVHVLLPAGGDSEHDGEHHDGEHHDGEHDGEHEHDSDSGKYGSPPAAVPEPGSLVVWGLLSVTGLIGVIRRAKK